MEKEDASTDWHKDVFRPKDDTGGFYATEEWKRLRRKCLRRDKYRCQRCSKHHAYGKYLSAHHITPRLLGGKDELRNLLSLCEPCHDYVEIHKLLSYAAIVGSIDAQGREQGTIEHEYADDWRKWIYGSATKPPAWWQRLCHEKSKTGVNDAPRNEAGKPLPHQALKMV